MKAIVLAAGFGKRLRPLTDYLPKALVPILGVPAINHVLRRLHEYGVRQVGVNVHYRAEQIRSYLESDRWLETGCQIRKEIKFRIHHEEQILGTGGALDNFRDFLWGDGPFWVYNGDVISDIDLACALHFHQAREALATLILWDYPPINTVSLDREGNIISLFERPGGASMASQSGRETRSGFLTFTGISILSPRILDYVPSGYCEMPTIYQQIIASEGVGKICGFRGKGSYWADFGTISSYLDVHRHLMLLDHPQQTGQALVDGHLHWGVARQHDIGCVHRAGPGIVISSRAKLLGFVSIGAGCIIEDDVCLEDCVLWPETRVLAGFKARRAVVGKNFICREEDQLLTSGQMDQPGHPTEDRNLDKR
ncbi:MAG: NDP-sugar synthase [bacterium]|nr:NDP-sugar synthase [bacterium]